MARKGLTPVHSPEDILKFETVWLKARRPYPQNLGAQFPLRIEGLSLPIWYKSYLSKSEKFHAPTVPCLLCAQVQKIMNEILKCPCYPISLDCPQCKEKTKIIPYFNRGILSDLHSKHRDLLHKGRIGGEVRMKREPGPTAPLMPRTPAKAWSNPHNDNRRGEPLETYIRRELLLKDLS